MKRYLLVLLLVPAVATGKVVLPIQARMASALTPPLGVITTVAGGGVGDGGVLTNAELNNPRGMAIDASGDIYVADLSNCRVREITHTGIATIAGTGICGFGGDGGVATNAELNLVDGVAVDATGNVYIADSWNCRVREVRNGIITTVAGIGTGSSAGCGYSGDGGPAASAKLDGPSGLAVDAQGNLYIADELNSALREVTGGIITTISSGHGFWVPRGLALDSAGNLYVADTYGCKVDELSGGVVSVIAGGGSCIDSGDGGPALSAGLDTPSFLAVDGAGNVFVSEDSCRVREISGGVINTVVGKGGCGYAGDGGPATNALLNRPEGIGFDPAHNLYIDDDMNCRMRVVGSGGVISTYAGTGSCSYGGDAGPAVGAALSEPEGIGIDASGNLLIADYNNCRVREVIGGTINTVAGSALCGFTGDGGPATSAQIGAPAAVATSSRGDIFIADAAHCQVRDIRAGTISTVAGSGVCGYAGDGGPATQAELNRPFGLALDASGNLYISDDTNCSIRKVSGGTITTVVGNGTCAPSAETAPYLQYPGGLALDSFGDLYIADTLNCRVLELALSQVITVAGNGICSYSGDGGQATKASLRFPVGVVVDALGNVYIADTSNCAVREVIGQTIFTVAGTPQSCGYGGDGGPAAGAQMAYPQGLALDGAGNLYVSEGSRIRMISGGALDSDGDGYPDIREIALGKNPLTYCPIMRADVNMDGVVNMVDLSAVAAFYHVSVPPAPQRFDQGPTFDNVINILDLSKMAAVYNRPVTACP